MRLIVFLQAVVGVVIPFLGAHAARHVVESGVTLVVWLCFGMAALAAIALVVIAVANAAKYALKRTDEHPEAGVHLGASLDLPCETANERGPKAEAPTVLSATSVA